MSSVFQNNHSCNVERLILFRCPIHFLSYVDNTIDGRKADALSTLIQLPSFASLIDFNLTSWISSFSWYQVHHSPMIPCLSYSLHLMLTTSSFAILNWIVLTSHLIDPSESHSRRQSLPSRFLLLTAAISVWTLLRWCFKSFPFTYSWLHPIFFPSHASYSSGSRNIFSIDITSSPR